MPKNLGWIWFLALLTAVGLIAAGCGDPSLADRDDALPAAGAPSSNEATAEPPSTEAQAEEADLARRQSDLDRREAELEARESRLRRLESEAAEPISVAEVPEADSQNAGRLETDRFRAIPMQRESAVETPSERFEEVALLVPAGTPLQVEFVAGLSSESNAVGDRFAVRVTEAVTVDGYFAVPIGAGVGGEVVDVRPARRIGGQAHLALAFDRLETPAGTTLPIVAWLDAMGSSERGKDAAMIAGGAAAGAIVGRSVKPKDKTEGGFLGALVGAAVGAGVAARTKGEPVVIPAGTLATLVLEEDLPVTIRLRVLES